jgi:hypothetical protein
VAEHPYRAEVVRVDGKRELLAESERSPRRVRVRAWSDRTTRISLRGTSHLLPRVGFSFLTLVFGVMGFAEEEPRSIAVGYMIATLFLVLTLRTFRAERITVSPAAVARRKRFGRTEVRPLVDVSTVVVSGDGEDARLDLQCGRERVQLAQDLGYDEKTLRWIAQRLRRAIEAAR